MGIGEYESVLLHDEPGPVGGGHRLPGEEVPHPGILDNVCQPPPKFFYSQGFYKKVKKNKTLLVPKHFSFSFLVFLRKQGLNLIGQWLAVTLNYGVGIFFEEKN